MKIEMTQFFLPLIGAALGAFLTAQFALRRFFKEKMWEAKLNAYNEIFVALHHMKRDLEISIRAEEAKIDTDTDFHKKWSEKHTVAWDNIREKADVGVLLLSDESVDVLQKMVSESTRETKWYYEHLQIGESAIEKCLPDLKKSARKDLGLSRV